MKPIKLTIKGLNSFIDTQVIDFNRLTEHGLFGVFGPTGSGKSTILDGITIALYGKNSRSSNNFINTQCDQMQVVFEFSVSDKVYEITRTYRRQHESIHASKPTRLVCESLVLAESTKEVDQLCLEVIGLKFEDFIRTVVLPQGKFSEFIKLKGKDRRNMLERLFNLERYGDQLTIGLNKRIRKMKDEDTLLAGELKAYAEISKDKIKEVKDQLENEEVQSKKIEKSFTESRKEYEENSKLYQNILELEQSKKDLLNHTQQDIKPLEKVIETYEHVKPVIALYHRYKENKVTLSLLNEKHLDLKGKVELQKNQAEKTQTAFNILKVDYSDQLSNYQEKIHKMKTGLELVDLVEVKKKNFKSQNQTFMNEKESLSNYEKESKKNEKQLSQVIDHIGKLEKAHKEHLDALLIEPIVDQGYKLAEIITNDMDFLNHDQVKKTKLLTESEKLNLDLQELIKSIEEIVISDQKMTFEEYQNQILVLNKKKEDLESLKANHDLKAQLEKQLESLSKATSSIEAEFKAYKVSQENNLLMVLQESLHVGDSCPLCGHEISHLKTLEMDSLDDAIENKYHQHLHHLKQVEKELSELPSDTYRESDYEALLVMTKQLDLTYKHAQDNEKLRLEKDHLNIRKDDIKKQLSNILSNQLELDREIKDKEVKLESNRVSLKNLEDTHKITDFLKAKEVLMDHKESEYRLRSQLDSLRSDQKLMGSEKDRLNKNLNEQKLLVSQLEMDLKHLSHFIDEKTTSLEDDFGDFSRLDIQLKEIKLKEKELIDSYSHLEKTRQEYNDLYQKTFRDFESNRYLIESKLEANEQFEEDLAAYNEKDLMAFDQEALDHAKKVVEAYNKQLLVLRERIETMAKKVNDKHITKDQVDHLEAYMKDLQIKRETFIKAIAVTKEILRGLEIKYNEMGALYEKKEALEYQLSLYGDLEKLFRGKKFVEFIAGYQLKYVTLEASEKLYEITSGKYSLELDDSQFIVRDLSSGGAMRSMSTLSGGESFLVSLALALALSSQIQLKGKAPLELFFLDEGFGTLDDYVLDMVMTALEKIHHQYLSIGLISHVEKIKNRVPIKLNVSPSTIERGSQVKIERT